jgi:hypothetical protein
MRSPALVFLVAAALACGGGSSSPPAPPPDPGGGNPGGGGSPPSGGGGGGSQPGGGGGGGSQPPAGGGGGGGSGPVTSADGTVRIERVDTAAECDFVPTRAPDVVSATADGDFSCQGGVSDGSGHVAATTHTGAGWAERQAFSPDGKLENRFSTGWLLFPQADGFVAVHGGARTSPYAPRVEAFFGDGSPRRTTRFGGTPDEPSIHQWTAGEDPLGGALLVFAWHRADGTGACDGEAHRFDGFGAPGAIARGVGCLPLAAAVSNRGEALVLERSPTSEVRLHWLLADGGVAREPTVDGKVDDLFPFGVTLVPLLDGSIAARNGGRFSRRYPHLGDRSEPAPAWLADMPAGSHHRFTRGNQGYAWFPPEGEQRTDCVQTAELRAPSGRLCAKVTFSGPTGSCRVGPLDQGWDGTVVWQPDLDHCAWRWWPGLLAKE